MPDAILDLHVESFVRDGRLLLDDVRWKIRRGEHWALLGANGSGKSTLLSIVAAYEWPTKGTVHVLGEQYGRCDMTAMKRRIGLVSARMYHLLPDHQIGRVVVASGLHALIGDWRVFDAEELAVADRALERIRALDCADKPYGLMSQGQKQRVLIARALVRTPELLVLDEPCDGLDPVARERFLGDLAHACASADAVDPPAALFVTHHVEEIPSFVTHAMLLKSGRVVAAGPIDEALCSASLSEAFDARCELDVVNGRFRLSVRV